MNKKGTNNALFERARVLIMQDTYTDVEVFELIGLHAADAPGLARSIAFHIRDILTETEGDIDYTEVVCEMYRRVYFDKEAAKKYGDIGIAGDPRMAAMFVEYLENRSAIDSAGKSTVFPMAAGCH